MKGLVNFINEAVSFKPKFDVNGWKLTVEFGKLVSINLGGKLSVEEIESILSDTYQDAKFKSAIDFYKFVQSHYNDIVEFDCDFSDMDNMFILKCKIGSKKISLPYWSDDADEYANNKTDDWGGDKWAKHFWTYACKNEIN